MPAAITKRIVLDASVAVTWCFEDENTHFTEGVLDLLSTGTEVVTPAIWPFEVANALLMAERRKRITLAQLRPYFGVSPDCLSRSSLSNRGEPSSKSCRLRDNRV